MTALLYLASSKTIIILPLVFGYAKLLHTSRSKSIRKDLMWACNCLPTTKMLYTSLPRLEAFIDTEPMDDRRKRTFPIAPHSEANAFIGAGYWFLLMNPDTASRLPISLVDAKPK